MTTFHCLRPRSNGPLGRVVLLWFMASLLAAIASPIVRHCPMKQMPATVHSMQMMAPEHTTEGGAPKVRPSHFDCPLCLQLDAPPPALPAYARPPLPQPLRHALQPIPAARIAAITGAPLPARGPPLAL